MEACGFPMGSFSMGAEWDYSKGVCGVVCEQGLFVQFHCPYEKPSGYESRLADLLWALYGSEKKNHMTIGKQVQAQYKVRV